MIYLASPYSYPDESVRLSRFKAACIAASFFMREGHHVFSPIAHTHPIAVHGGLPTGWDFWWRYDRWFIEHADEVRVLTLPGWDESIGVAAEIKIAIEFGKPVTWWECVGDGFRERV